MIVFQKRYPLPSPRAVGSGLSEEPRVLKHPKSPHCFEPLFETHAILQAPN